MVFIAIRGPWGYYVGYGALREGGTVQFSPRIVAMARDQLSDAKIRRAKPSARAYKLYDGGGLFLLVHTNGSRYWRLKYRIARKEKLFAIGVYPEVSLADARAKAIDARRLVRE